MSLKIPLSAILKTSKIIFHKNALEILIYVGMEDFLFNLALQTPNILRSTLQILFKNKEFYLEFCKQEAAIRIILSWKSLKFYFCF